MAQVRLFEGADVAASVLLSNTGEYLEIGEHGVLKIPDGVKPNGFNLVIFVPDEGRIVVTQKNVGQTKGNHHRHALQQVGLEDGVQTWVMHDHIEVRRVGPNAWTSWHEAKPNRVDLSHLCENGHLDCFLLGIVTHDDAETFRLLNKFRWRGQLYQSKGEIVGKPEDPSWGSFEVRKGILKDEKFQGLLETAHLPYWNGSLQELDPPLRPIPGQGIARVEWYSLFGGQTGQGIANLHPLDYWKNGGEGENAWVHGVDIDESPDEDGVKSLHPGQLISFSDKVAFGSQKGRPPKLLNVKVVQ